MVLPHKHQRMHKPESHPGIHLQIAIHTLCSHGNALFLQEERSEGS